MVVTPARVHGRRLGHRCRRAYWIQGKNFRAFDCPMGSGSPAEPPSKSHRTSARSGSRARRRREGLSGPYKRGNNLGTIAPEHRGRAGNRADQEARRVNKLDNPALSAKPHHGFKSGARNEQCRPTCTWWPHEANRVVLLGISLGGVFAPALAREKRCAASSCSERWPHAHRRIPAARSASSRNSMRSMFRRRGRQSIHVSSCGMGQATSALSDAVLDFLQTLG